MTIGTAANPIQHALRVTILVNGDERAPAPWTDRSDTIIRGVVDSVHRVIGEALEGAMFSAPTGYLEGCFFQQSVEVYAQTSSGNVTRARGDTSDLVRRLQWDLGQVFGDAALPTVQIDRIDGFGGSMTVVPQSTMGSTDARNGVTVLTPSPVQVGAPYVERTTMLVQPPARRVAAVVGIGVLLGALLVSTVFLAVLLGRAERSARDTRAELAAAHAALAAKGEDLGTCEHRLQSLGRDYRDLDADKRATDDALGRKVDELVACAAQRQCPRCEPSLVVCPPRRASLEPAPWEE